MLSVKFPPVRNIFIPDPGWTFFEIDLAGADAQVVAWECDDEDLKAAFRAGVKIHIKNGCDIWGRDVMYSKDPKGKSEPFYTRVKRGVHLTNYGGQETALAIKCEMTIPESRKFRNDWFALHPNILEWHERTMFELQTTGITTNKFGYSIPWFDRPSIPLRNKALAWKPQSTVAHVTEEAMIRIDDEMQENVYFERYLRLLMNVHDSLGFQVKTEYIEAVIPRLYDILHAIEVPYDDPLIIPWGIKYGSRSWGQCEEKTWEEVINESRTRRLAQRVHGIHGGHGSSV